jgi:xylulokinase
MSEYFLGIDSGTQSTKTILFEADSGSVVASASVAYDLIEGLPPGHKEQHPQTWFDAVNETVLEVLANSRIDRSRVKGIGISGQQHGFVPLDESDEVIRPAKLWCDTSTSEECEEIISALGGFARTIEEVGNAIPAGFTASKILWLKRHEPENFERLRWVLLPHDYINFRLTGAKSMEFGDASGTALFDVRRRTWSDRAVEAIDPRLKTMLPAVVAPGGTAGRLIPELSRKWGLSSDVTVSTGGGDNMMGAIGTGNVTEGVVTVSLGTSGTIYACSETPVVDPEGIIAAFCDSTGRWLPLVCTMNVTVATEMVRERFNLSHDDLSNAAAKVSPGSDGLLLIPFFEGERTPNVPEGTGVFFGVRDQTFDAAHFARAAMEGTTLGLNYGLNRMRELGIEPLEIRATGGGARSSTWRQILADVFNTEVVSVKNEEGAAFGAALQAVWARTGSSIKDLCTRYVTLDETTRMKPDLERVEKYRKLQELMDSVVKDLDGAFREHRRLITQ